MRMLQPSPGECVDRQTILRLKMAAAETGEARTVQGPDKIVTDGEQQWGVNRTVMKGAAKVDTTPFTYEHEALQQYLEREWIPNAPATIEDSFNLLSDKLEEVNQKLWKLEDEARALRRVTQTTARALRCEVVLFEITDLNDDRAKLVQEIDKLFGVNTQEKMYAQA